MEFSEADLTEREDDEDLETDLSVVHVASSAGDLDVLTKVIRQDPSLLEQSDSDGLTPLAHAVLSGQVEVVKLLVKMGASINSQDHLGRTSLSMAAYQGWYDGLVFLLRNGAKQNTVDRAGRTPLHASTYDVDPRTMVALLQSMTSDELKHQDNEGMTVLHWAAFHNRPKHVQILMDRGVNVHTKDIDGKTALHWAAQNGSVSCCHHLLMCKNASKLVNLTDFSGKSAVHFAAAAGHSKVIQELSKVEGCDLEIEDPDERLPLHWAAATCQFEAVSMLLSLNVDPNPIDAEGGTPLDYARQSGHTACIELLERKLGIDKSSEKPRHISETDNTFGKSKKNPFGFFVNLFKNNRKPEKEYSLEISDENQESVGKNSPSNSSTDGNLQHEPVSSKNTSKKTSDSLCLEVLNRSKQNSPVNVKTKKMEHNLGELRPSHGQNIPLDLNTNVLPPPSSINGATHDQVDPRPTITSPRRPLPGDETLITSPRSMPPDAEAILAAQNKKAELPVATKSESLVPLPANKTLTPLLPQETDLNTDLKHPPRLGRLGAMIPAATSLVSSDGDITPRRSSAESLVQLAPLRVPAKARSGTSLPPALINKQLAVLKNERLGADRTPTPPPWADLPPPSQNNGPMPLSPRSSGGHIHEFSYEKKTRRKSKNSMKSPRSPEGEQQTDSEKLATSPGILSDIERVSLASRTPVLNSDSRSIAGSLSNRSPLPDLGKNELVSPVLRQSPPHGGATESMKGSTLIDRTNSPHKDQEMLDRSIQSLLH